MGINIRNLSFGYHGHSIFDNVSIEIPESKLTVMIGKNGSGKSTLLRLIAGIHRPLNGSIEVYGKDLRTLSIAERARLVGFLSQAHYPVFPFTTEDVVLTGRASYVFSTPGKLDRTEALRAIEQLGIEGLRTRPYNELSAGEQQLVMIARALAQKSKVMLLDEPTSHLDLPNQVRLFNIMKNLVSSGLTVIMVIHDPNMGVMYGENFIFIKNGKIVKPSDARKPYDRKMLSDVFDIEISIACDGEKSWIVPEN
jgi:ABC-type cobalamin/Fe3+-siderophores transport system ATPase subunit